MSVTNQTPFTAFTAAPGATVFSTEFRVILFADLVVRVNGATVTSGYTVAGIGAAGGVTVTFSTPMVGGELVELLRSVPLTRAVDYQNEGDFLSPVVNQDFDRLWMALQDQGFVIGGSLRLPFPEQVPALPAAAGRARKLFYFDEIGDPVLISGTPGTVLGFDGSGEPVAVVPADGSAGSLALLLAGSGGAVLVGFRTGTVADALASWPTLDQYLTPSELAAAISGAVVDMTTSLQAALTANKFVRAVSGRTYRFTTLNMAQPDACLYLGAGSVMAPSSPTVTGINVTGARCSIIGEGAITSPATFSGTNARRTYATIWVTGEGFTLRDVTLNNIPRCGIHFEDATGWLVQNVTFNGNTPYTFYTGTEVGHLAIDYNPPTTAGATDFQSGRVLGCRIRQCVQGVFFGNFDSYGSTAGVVIVGNVFESCWNHGIYLTLAEASTITGNTFLDCQVPIVTDGNGCVISGNTLYTTEPSTRTNSWQVIQVREARNTRIVDNVLIGPDAGISLECVSGTDISGNSIEGNTIVRTARAATGFVIRLGNGASTCRNNRISNNTITGTMGITTGNVIELTMLAGNFGFDNEVIDNTIEMTDPCQLLQVDRHRRTIVKDNKLQCAGSTAAPEIIRMMQIIDSIGCAITDNRFIWETGGTNVTVRGIQAIGTVTGTRYEDNVFDLTATFAVEQTIQNIGGGGQTYTRNLLDGGNSALIGSAIIVAGTPSITVTNGNCLIGYSRVFLQPLDANAGALPVYVTIANGSFTISTASGGNAAANSAYAWEIK
jgi:parallel beta-helix repeat protein